MTMKAPNLLNLHKNTNEHNYKANLRPYIHSTQCSKNLLYMCQGNSKASSGKS